MKILIYEGCEFIQRAMSAVLANHDLTVVNEIATKEGTDELFAIDAHSKNEFAIDASQFDLAFVDRQMDGSGETLQLVTFLVNANLPCVGTSVMSACNAKIMTVAKFALAKVVVISALRSGVATPEDFLNLDDETIAELQEFEQALLHPKTPAMVSLRAETEEFLQLQLKAA